MVMTPTTIAFQPAIETLPILEAVAVAAIESLLSLTTTTVREVTMGFPEGVVGETLLAIPKVRAKILVSDKETDTQEGVMEIPVGEGLRM